MNDLRKLIIIFSIFFAYRGSSVCNTLLDTSRVVNATMSGPGCPTSGIGSISPSLSNFTAEICFDSGSSSSNSFTVVTGSQFVLRRLEFSSLVDSSLRIGSTDSADKSVQWYITPRDRDNANQWTTLPVHGFASIAPDVLPFSNLTVWIKTNSSERIQTRVSLFGCWADETQSVDYTFNSTEKAVKQQFRAVQFFESLVTSVVIKSGLIDPHRISVRLVEDTGTNNTVIIRVTVLPDPVSDQSVNDVVTYLTENKQLMKALNQVQSIITDDTAVLCFDKMCPSGSFCVNGLCRAQDSLDPIPAAIKPTFANMRAYAPNIQWAESAPGNSWVQEYKAYAIPLLVGAGALLIILALVARQWIKRKRS